MTAPARELPPAGDGTGEARYCDACSKPMPDGPDACLGFLPGVAHACCGHGRKEPYVCFGDFPGQSAYTIPDRVGIRGRAATAYFRLVGKDVPDSPAAVTAWLFRRRKRVLIGR